MARLERFTILLNSALSELKKRNLELLSSKELFDLIRYLEARLSEESSKISYITDKSTLDWSPLEEEVEKIPLWDCCGLKIDCFSIHLSRFLSFCVSLLLINSMRTYIKNQI